MTDASRPEFNGASPFGPGAFDLNRFFEAMDLARRNWGSFVSPASIGAGLDPGELDKRIADLRTVEQWLSLNLSLVQGSVKALEMQRATLDAMRAFGQQASAATSAADPMAAAASQAQEWWQGLQAQFRQVADAALAASRAPTTPSGAAGDAGGGPRKPAAKAAGRSGREGVKR